MTKKEEIITWLEENRLRYELEENILRFWKHVGDITLPEWFPKPFSVETFDNNVYDNSKLFVGTSIEKTGLIIIFSF